MKIGKDRYRQDGWIGCFKTLEIRIRGNALFIPISYRKVRSGRVVKSGSHQTEVHIRNKCGCWKVGSDDFKQAEDTLAETFKTYEEGKRTGISGICARAADSSCCPMRDH